MKADEIRSKRQHLEEVQDELFVYRKKFDYQQKEIQQVYLREKQNREQVLEYFQGESEQYLFEDGLEESRRNECKFLESAGEIMNCFSKRKSVLEEEADTLYKQELKERKEEDTHG